MSRVLLVGESWFVHSIHQKGFDTFTTSEYSEGGAEFVAALEAAGHQVRRIPAHRIEADFPQTSEQIAELADVVVISDVGTNSFALTNATFVRSQAEPDRIAAIRDFTANGGGLLKVGGYMSFSGIDAKARWGRSLLAGILPVEILDRDDRMEVPDGVQPVAATPHPITAGLGPQWPPLLGLNEVCVRESATTLATAGSNPLLVIGTAGRGRVAVFTSDLAPHWATPEFLAWQGYQPLFDRTVRWLSGDLAYPHLSNEGA